MKTLFKNMIEGFIYTCDNVPNGFYKRINNKYYARYKEIDYWYVFENQYDIDNSKDVEMKLWGLAK